MGHAAVLHPSKLHRSGINNLKDSPARIAAAGQAMESAGGTLISYHLTLGHYDAIVVSEAPSGALYTSVVLILAAQGNIRTTTIKAFTEEEPFRIFSNLP